MEDGTRPLLAIYVAWHPAYSDGLTIAEGIREHFRRELYENVAGGAGVSVIFRSAPGPGLSIPLDIDLAGAATTAVAVLLEPHLASDPAWVGYLRGLVEKTEEAGLQSRVFPIAIDRAALGSIHIDEQALNWDLWTGSRDARQRQLITELTYEFCRMLRYYLECLKEPGEEEQAFSGYMKKVLIFISHSKHDNDGERVARLIRNRLHAGHGLESFFDVHDIPAGLRFQKVLHQQIRVSAMVAIHTDSYSSREWCRREIIEAKRWNVPLVVADCLRELDERGFPYMGNVPTVRVDPRRSDRIDIVVGRLLDEVLKDMLWRCRVEASLPRLGTTGRVAFLPRTPELLSLANLLAVKTPSESTIVYPDPPLSAEEEGLFAAVAPTVQLQCLTEWLARQGL
jgi:hypothetical protein